MEFGVFAQLFVPAVRARRRPAGRAQAHHAQRRDRQGGRPQRASSTCGARSTTSSTSTATCPGPRRSSSYCAAPDRAGPPRLGDLQHHAAGEQAGARRRERRPARPPHRQPLRVRHRPGLVDHRGARLRHRRASTRPRPCGARRSARSRRCGRTRRTATRASTSACPSARCSPSRNGPLHPAMWVAAGSPRTFTEAGELGLGAFCFSIGRPQRHGAAGRRRTRRRSANATPVGDYVNDNIMGVTNMLCMEDRNKAFETAVQHGHELLHDASPTTGSTTSPKPEGPARVAEQDPRADARAGREAVGRGLHRRRRPRRLRHGRCSAGSTSASTSSRFSPTTNTLPTEVVVGVDGAVRPRGHPAVRHRPGALAPPATARGGGQARPSDAARRSGGRRTTRGRDVGAPGRAFNLADVWEMAADAVRRARGAGRRRPAPHLRASSRSGPTGWRTTWPGRGVGPGDHVGALPRELHRVPRGDARRVQAAGRADQRQPPLRRRRAALPARRQRRGRASITPAVAGRRPSAARRARRCRRCGFDARDGRRLRGGAGRRALARRARSSRAAAATTTTSSTPAAPPACPRASCGARRTPSSPASAAATRCGCTGRSSEPDELPDRIVDSQFVLPAAGAADARRRPVDVALVVVRRRQGRAACPGSLDPRRGVAADRAPRRSTSITVVGDAVARPLLDAWDAPSRRPYDVVVAVLVLERRRAAVAGHPRAHLRHAART